MRTIDTQISIAASAETVWAILANFADHDRWNPLFKSIAGEPHVGGRLHVAFRNGWTMKPRVTELRPNQVLEWLGSLGVRGIFDGRHRFAITAEGAGGCTLRQSERFSGILVPFVGRILADTERGFRELNAALKHEAEAAWAKSAG